jgi:hypothetical protein
MFNCGYRMIETQRRRERRERNLNESEKGVALDRVSVVVALPVTQGSRQGVTVKQP